MKKQKPIQPQGPWTITSYSDIQYPGTKDEFDAGYIEFKHEETNIVSHHEMDWLKSERSYKGKKTPTLLDVWNMFLRDTPGTTGFRYRMSEAHEHVSWHIKRMVNCFQYILIDMGKSPPQSLNKKNIISDLSQKKIDMAAFLWLLDDTQREIEGKATPIINLDEMRERRNA